MAQNTNKEKHISVRVTNGTHSQLTTYSKAHNLTLSKAVETLIEKGLQSELEPLATRKDIELLKSESKERDLDLEKSLIMLNDTIKNYPIQIQPQNLLEFEEEKPKQSFWKRLFS